MHLVLFDRRIRRIGHVSRTKRMWKWGYQVSGSESQYSLETLQRCFERQLSDVHVVIVSKILATISRGICCDCNLTTSGVLGSVRKLRDKLKAVMTPKALQNASEELEGNSKRYALN